ncbi:MAG: GntR family transcriptional regulator [Roseiflexaceae bacterium]|nr:GntR family transcriptional regulator [Roseiflexaceae bacterium]
MTIEQEFPQLTGDSRRHRAAHALREAIITGRLQAGDRLVEEDLSKQMGISRGPIREAFRQLEHEGLIISLPYRGSEVVGVSIKEVREVIVPIRIVLERFAFQHAIMLLTEEDFVQLARIIDMMRIAANTHQVVNLVQADMQFHELILERSGQAHCHQIWRTIATRVRVYFTQSGYRYESLHVLVDSHQLLLDALRTRDREHMLAILEEHIRDVPSIKERL